MPQTSSHGSDDAQYAAIQELISQDKLAEARAALAAMANAGTRLLAVYSDLGAIALQNDELETAKEHFKKVLELDATPVLPRRYLAFLYGLEGNFDLAFATLSPLLRNPPTATEDIDLLKRLLEKVTRLTPITWARLLTDLKTPTAEVKAIIDGHQPLLNKLARLEAEKQNLLVQVNELKEELYQSNHDANGGNAWERINRLSLEEWQAALIRSVEVPSYKGFPLPAFPSDTLQILTVGSSNQSALTEGMNFYRAVSKVLEENDHSLTRESPLLDFGTGWGRYARIFMHDVHPDHITGVDVMPNMIDTCKRTFPYGSFKLVPSLPPSDLPGDHYQLIIAYSVFSHLSEAAATAWIKEFARILAPGGMIAITTQGRRFLKYCEELRKQERQDSVWHENLARSFIDRPACEAAYDRGELLFSATGGGDALSSSFYGEALVPPKFVEKHWTEYLDLIEFNDDGQLPQALIVMRKPF